MSPITPELVLRAYASGLFPMAEARDDPSLFWVDPDMRGIIPFNAVHISRRLAKTVRRNIFRVTQNHCFTRIIDACADTPRGSSGTWINGTIIDLYVRLHGMGYAHSVECWDGKRLVGGLYGIALGGAFFGESMFSWQRDASKVALTHLIGRLIFGGYVLLDTQFITDHLKRFGAVEISREDYHSLLEAALPVSASFTKLPPGCDGSAVMQSITQMS